ncbi:LPS export ABC transporter periplasmic protein LptC [Vibrio sp. SS-MA-C1-2]|uniref:LPS export ABC transporter periplasmic protein LptC n=1 Tax=Vibrio sp. SS-MA-C1-2 TaxID=2908646 RepID=UPI001F25A47C|nr:LPS export ABC transporter periplasmic protein LptC [Vibrio sp. SS-MA-C1-2]UJF19586.1 LPS export ABC transporter periplasmic protein LptC [Vibrio sp. SS-MA-C1-2]
MTLKRLTLCLIIICGFLGYYLAEKHLQPDIQVQPDTEKPTLIGHDITNNSFTLKGLLNYQIKAQKLEYFEAASNTLFQQPEMTLFRLGTDKEWVLTSDRATLTKEQILILNGNVKIRNLLPDSPLKLMTTDYLVVDLISKDFSSDQPIKFTGVNFSSSGNAIQGNFDRNEAELKDQTRGIYENIKK